MSIADAGQEVGGQVCFGWGIVRYMARWPLAVREAAALFGRMGGRAEGRKMTKEARIARARKAAIARWGKRKKQPKVRFTGRY